MADRIVVGLIGIAVGIAFVVYARKLVEWFGPWPYWETKLGSGGSYTAMRITGILTTTIAFLYMTNLLQTVIFNIASAIF